MNKDKIEWTTIKGTGFRYILTSRGRVFSGKHGDYLKLQERNFYFYVRLQYDNEKKPKNISIYSLLKEYFPNSLQHKEYYFNKERYKEIYG